MMLLESSYCFKASLPVCFYFALDYGANVIEWECLFMVSFYQSMLLVDGSCTSVSDCSH